MTPSADAVEKVGHENRVTELITRGEPQAVVYSCFAKAFDKTPSKGGTTVLYTASMKHFIVDPGDFIATTGIYRMLDHPGREITLVYGDAVPTFQGKKVKFTLIRAAKNPRRG
jgi:hypothetical protein